MKALLHTARRDQAVAAVRCYAERIARLALSYNVITESLARSGRGNTGKGVVTTFWSGRQFLTIMVFCGFIKA